MGKTVFLADTNTFITPFRSYYSFDFAPSFWKHMEFRILDGSIMILDKVFAELTNVDDKLSEWLLNIKGCSSVSHKDRSILAAYSDVLTHVQTSGFYNAKALAEWADDRVADPWLIACGIVCKYTVVTFERANGNLNVFNKSSDPKIPDVCNAFGVEHTNLFDMMRSLSITIT